MGPVLFFAPARLGDAVLASAALAAALLRAPGAELEIVCDAEVGAFYRAAPRLVRHHHLSARPRASEWLSLWRTLSARRYGLIADARGAPISMALRADGRAQARRSADLANRARRYADMFETPKPGPTLWLDERAREEAEAGLPQNGPVLALAPAAERPERAWPAECYAAVARRLASPSGPLAGARIALIAPPSLADRTRAIARSLEADGVASVNLGGVLDTLATAALLERVTLCIGEHSPALHLAAAAGAPTLGLFGPSDERVHGPVGPRARALRGRPYEELAAAARDGSAAESLMGDVTVDAVEAASLDLLRAGGLG